MKKTLSVLVMMALVLGAFVAGPADAKKKKKKKKDKAPVVRVVEGTYDRPAPGIGGVLTFSGQGGSIEVPTTFEENFVTIEVVDDVGPDVYFGLSQEDTDGDGIGEIIYGGCSKTAEPLPITGGLLHTITVTTGPGAEAPDCAGFATSGTIKVSLSSSAEALQAEK